MRLGKYYRIAVFDSPSRENFYPLSLTRPTFDMLSGTKTLLHNLESLFKSKATDLFVPKYLEQLTKETHGDYRVNQEINQKCLVLNSLVRPNFPLLLEIEKHSQNSQDLLVVDSLGIPVFGFLERFHPSILSSVKDKLIQKVGISESQPLPPLFNFPWEIVSENIENIRIQRNRFAKTEGFKRAESYEVLGRDLHISDSATVERFVTFDTREGPVIVDKGCIIQSFSHVSGPAYIGEGAIVKAARIRKGTTIGGHCLVGGEVEQSIFFDHTNKNHEGFIGHSILGSWINLGALTTNSDLKNTYGQIKVNVPHRGVVNTGEIKVGCFIGDMSKTAIGTLISSGKTIGVSSHVFGSLVKDVPSFTMFAESLGSKSVEIYVESAVETQRRMMERRKIVMSKHYENMIRFLFSHTAKDRASKKVLRKKFELA